MSFSVSLSIGITIFLFIRVLAENCPPIQLIQPLDEETGLSYIIVTTTKYYMITKEQIEGTAALYDPFPIPNGFENSTLITVYFNEYCSPPQYYLILHKIKLDQMNQVFDENVLLNLIDSKQRQSKWSKPSRFVPDFLQYDNYMNARPFTFTMLWKSRKSLYLVQLPQKGEPVRNDYHTIKLNQSCDTHQYIGDYDKKITDILKPYEDFESCFIHNDKLIICFGPKGFSSFDIDLEESKEGLLRVTNVTEDVQQIPIMRIIEDIRKNCGNLNTNPFPAPMPSTVGPIPSENETHLQITTDLTEDLTENLTEDLTHESKGFTNKDMTEETPTTSFGTQEPQRKSSALFWILILIIMIFILISAITLLYCFRKKAEPKDKLKQTPGAEDTAQVGAQSDLKSNLSTKTQFGDRLNASTIGSSPSTRSMTNNTNTEKYMSNVSTIDDQSSVRSDISGTNANKGKTVLSTTDSKTSMRSQSTVNAKGNTTEDMSKGSTIDEQPSMRSQTIRNAPQKSTIGETTIESNVSMRSTNDSKQKQNQQ